MVSIDKTENVIELKKYLWSKLLDCVYNRT